MSTTTDQSHPHRVFGANYGRRAIGSCLRPAGDLAEGCGGQPPLLLNATII